MKIFFYRHWITVLSGIIGPVFAAIIGFLYFENSETPKIEIAYSISAFVAVIIHIAFTTILINQKFHDAISAIEKKISDTKMNLLHLKRK